jgi:GxxExxY protein
LERIRRKKYLYIFGFIGINPGRKWGMDIDEVTGIIVDTAYHLHCGLGPGLLESVYESILVRELKNRSLIVENEKFITFEYNGETYSEELRVDILVENQVVVELKSIEAILPVHKKQVLTYLRLLNLPVGLLINFGANTFKEGVCRIANNHNPSSISPLRINR